MNRSPFHLAFTFVFTGAKVAFAFARGFQKDIAFAFVKFLKRNKQINIISGAGRVFFEQDFYKSTSLNTLTKVFDLKNAVCVHRNLLCVHHVHFKILAFAFAF